MLTISSNNFFYHANGMFTKSIITSDSTVKLSNYFKGLSGTITITPLTKDSLGEKLVSSTVTIRL